MQDRHDSPGQSMPPVVSPADRTECQVRFDGATCPWQTATNASQDITVHARGGAFVGDEFRAGQALAQWTVDEISHSAESQPLDAAKALVPRLNGQWAMIVRTAHGQTLAAVDRLRSIPLFYGRDAAGDVVISPSGDRLADALGARRLDAEAELEFLLSGYIMGDRTLLEGIHQIQPGELIQCGNGKVEHTRYYRFLPETRAEAGPAELAAALDGVMDRVFARLARALAGQCIVVPLSGGLDSRLILAMLKRHGHAKLLGLTYGSADSTEARIARDVAEALEVPFEFVSYDPGEWTRLMRSPEMVAFWWQAGQHASMPHLQDYLALHKLRRARPDLKAVFMPGTLGGMIPGAWTPEHFAARPDSLDVAAVCRWLVYLKYNFWPMFRAEKVAVKRRIMAFFDEAPLRAGHNSAAAFDLFEFENRQARYIANSVRSFEAHGYDWWLPLCDHELMEFFLTVPTELRELKRLYATWMRDRVFVGAMRRLAEIPPAGDGRCVWYGEPRQALHGWRKDMRRLWQAAWYRTMPRAVKRLLVRRRVRNAVAGPLRFNEWFTLDATMTLGDLLRGSDTLLSGLSPHLAKIVARREDYPVQAESFQLLAAVYLAALRRRLSSA